MGLRLSALVPFFILGDMEKAFLTRLDELNVIIPEIYLKSDRKEDVIEEILELLAEAYLLGIKDSSEMMNEEIKPDEARMEEVIFLRIAGLNFEDRAERHIENGDLPALQTLTETEYHRVYNTAAADGVEEVVRETGKPVAIQKTWHTMRDDRVRDTHIDLEGVTVKLGQEFFTSDGDHSPFPGGFSNVENNANCRCWLTYRRVNA